MGVLGDMMRDHRRDQLCEIAGVLKARLPYVGKDELHAMHLHGFTLLDLAKELPGDAA